MDLIDRLRDLSLRIPKLKEENLLKTEEGTKNALVMPFINALGYNVFDPLEVTPELVADVGTKKGEKVDYAILREGKPIMLFECKIFGTNLAEVHASQLYRYFTVTSARFGILTNGVEYRFYTDLDQQNIMDTNPFFVFDMADIKDAAIEELKKFSKSAFNVDAIVTAASELKYKGAIRTYLTSQLNAPSDDLVKLLMQSSGAYAGRFTQPMLDGFRPVVRDGLRAFISEQVENRLKSALASETAQQVAPAPAETEVKTSDKAAVVTTEEEMDAYNIIRAILREKVDVKRITLRDAQSYCAVLLDDNNRRPIARLYFGAKSKTIVVFDEHKQDITLKIESVDDVYKHADALRASLARFMVSG